MELNLIEYPKTLLTKELLIQLPFTNFNISAETRGKEMVIHFANAKLNLTNLFL